MASMIFARESVERVAAIVVRRFWGGCIALHDTQTTVGGMVTLVFIMAVSKCGIAIDQDLVLFTTFTVSLEL